MEYKQIQIYFFLLLLIGVLILTFFLFLPYMSALVLAGTLGVVFYPMYLRMTKFLPESLASLAAIAIILLIVLLPLIFFSVLVFEEARGLYASLVYGDIGAADVFGRIESFVNGLFPGGAVALDISAYLRNLLGALVNNFGSIFSSFAGIVVAVLISIFALYYFFKDGKRLKKAVVALSPLADTYDEQIFQKLRVAVNSVMRGSLLIAVIQGILAGIGYLIFGVPNPALWGGITIIASLVPAVGTAAILVPALIYLIVAGKTIAFFGLLIWGVVVVGAVDNFLRPLLMERSMHIHPLLILLGVLGGLALFGPIGFLLGPLVVSFLFALLDIYKEEFKEYIYQGF